jgi:hypothetical protein
MAAAEVDAHQARAPGGVVGPEGEGFLHQRGRGGARGAAAMRVVALQRRSAVLAEPLAEVPDGPLREVQGAGHGRRWDAEGVQLLEAAADRCGNRGGHGRISGRQRGRRSSSCYTAAYWTRQNICVAIAGKT